MKKTNLMLAIILLSAIAVFPFLKKEINHENINITISENEKELSILAKFPDDKTRKVQKLLDNQLNQAIFTNAEFDATVTLDGKSSFYIKSTIGRLKIEFDKRKNTTESYRKMKLLGEELKGVLVDKK